MRAISAERKRALGGRTSRQLWRHRFGTGRDDRRRLPAYLEAHMAHESHRQKSRRPRARRHRAQRFPGRTEMIRILIENQGVTLELRLQNDMTKLSIEEFRRQAKRAIDEICGDLKRIPVEE